MDGILTKGQYILLQGEAPVPLITMDRVCAETARIVIDRCTFIPGVAKPAPRFALFARGYTTDGAAYMRCCRSGFKQIRPACFQRGRAIATFTVGATRSVALPGYKMPTSPGAPHWRWQFNRSGPPVSCARSWPTSSWTPLISKTTLYRCQTISQQSAIVTKSWAYCWVTPPAT